MRITAQCMGDSVRETVYLHHDGYVQGVFSEACYFTCNDEMLMLHDAAYGLIPFGIGITGLRDILKGCAIQSGLYVSCSAQMIEIAKAGFVIGLPAASGHQEVRHSRVVRVQPADYAVNAVAIAAEAERGSLKSLLKQMDELFAGEIPVRTSEDWNPFGTIAARGLAMFLPACLQEDAAQIQLGLKSLLGLGIGLTPSMDDWMTGYLYALHWFRQNTGRVIPFLDMLSSAVCNTAASYTSKISTAYLKAAAGNRYFSVLEDTMETLATSKKCAITGIGGSSGVDMLTGIAFACHLLSKSEVHSKQEEYYTNQL